MLLYFLLRDIMSLKVDDFINRTDISLRRGKIEECESIYHQHYNTFKDSILIKKRYCHFLYQIGEYNKIIELFENEDNEDIKAIVKKSKENILKEKDFIKNKEWLLKESKYCKRHITKDINIYLSEKIYDKAFDSVKKLHMYFPSDKKILGIYGQIQMVRGDYAGGMGCFSKIDLPLLNKIKKSVQMSSDIKYMGSISTRNNFLYLKNAITEIEDYYRNDKFSPSVFSKLLADNIYIFLEVCVKNELKDHGTNLADLLMEISESEKDKKIFLEILFLDKHYDRLEKELNKLKIDDKNFVRNMKSKLKEIKKNKERQYQQNKQRGYDTDPEGYYKILNVKPTATTKEILKKYRRLLVEVDPDNYEGDDPKEKERLEQKMMKLNKAKDVLSNEKSREEYDSGRSSFSNRGFKGSTGYQSYGGQDFQDIFSMFFGGGGSGFGSSGHTYYFTTGNSGGGFRAM
ncbi:Hsp 40 [Spraguea lophii 42_110]|uniref:Hsp 40 n=1 Tax=Spraguea lophii (strain 42_110) TaxID=1358809 RepID=S7XKX6_SPRLO|nr:Hsp 40 [Spraguea lophii 42_110]